MGYKLAGFDVIGCNEIDPRMMEVYQHNHTPILSNLFQIGKSSQQQDNETK